MKGSTKRLLKIGVETKVKLVNYKWCLKSRMFAHGSVFQIYIRILTYFLSKSLQLLTTSHFLSLLTLYWLVNIFSVKVFWSDDCLHPVIFMLLQNVCPNKCIDIWIINSVWSNRKVLMLFLQKITTFIAMRYSSCGIYAASFIRWREFIWSAQCL